MSTGGQIDAVPEPGESTRGGSGSAASAPEEAGAHWTEDRTPQEICSAYGSAFVPPAPLDRVAVALDTLDLPPLNARRVSPERGACGWYIWGGEGGGRSRSPGFFQTLQVAHLLERCPQIMPFLALAPGWRVRLAAGGPEIKPPHKAAPPANIAARRIGSQTSGPAAVKQWVWLSILLHILVVVLFGNTTGGDSGARRGQRLGGPLNVTLQGPVNRIADEQLALRADTRLSSLERREGAPAAVMPSRPVKDAVPAKVVSRPSPAPKAAEDVPVAPVMPPVIAREIEKPVTDFVVPAAIPEPVVPPEAPEPPAARVPVPISLPRLDAIVPPKAIEVPKVERDIALPTELVPRLAPLVPARTEREPTTPVEPAPRLKAFVPPRIEPEVVIPPLEVPRLAPLAPPQIEREVVRPAELLPRLPPVTPAVADSAAEPARVAPAAPVPTMPSTAAPAPGLPSASRAPAGLPGGTGTASDAPATTLPRGALAAPPPAQATPGSAPRIDLDAVRQRAREIAREGSGPRTLLPLNVRGREDSRTKEQQAFDKALKRPDCRDAYASLGLAAVVPLLLDTVSEKGCKW